MSEKIDITIDNSTDVEAGNEIVSTSTDNNIDIEILEPDYSVTINKREYVITGDNLYIPKTYDESPQWLKDIIGTITDFSLNQKLTEIGALSNTLYALIDELEVAKNTYTNSIITSAEIDERINTRIETLNSSIAESDATIVDLITTKATPTEASSLALNVLTSSINDGEISAIVSSLQNTISNSTSALSNSIDVVSAEMTGSFEGAATGIQSLSSYVGIDPNTYDPDGTGMLADIEILQKQNDGIIETISGTYDVITNPQDPNLAQLVISAEPYATWKASDVSGINTRLSHIGDVFIKYIDNPNGSKEYVASYKFIRTVVDSTSPYATDSDGFTWALIVDQAAQDAYEQALNAYDLADNKRRVFTATPSGPYDVGDLWTKTVTGGSMLYKSTATRSVGYTGSDWVVADDAGLNQFVDVTYTPTVTSLQNQVDGKVESWYTASTSDPKSAWTDATTRAKHDGDMWYQTDTKLSYYYSSSTNAWNLIDDAKAIQALADAATAQATADGKISSYYMSTLALAQSMSSGWTSTEKTNNIGDLVVVWNDSTLDNNGTWRWNGTSWVTTRDKKLIALASDVTNLSTELTNGTNTWASADSTLENSLMTEISDEGARVESKFAYNNTLMLNGTSYSSGFGIATSLTSGSGLPTGQSEFWINASKFKFTNTNQTGQVAPFTIDASGVTPQITFNGKVTFSNVTNTIGTGSNLLYNSAPKIGSETKGWYVWTNSGMTVNLSAGWDVWKPTGGASVAANIGGSPSIGSVFDVGQSSRFPVIAGSRYEASAYISAHRSNSYVFVVFYDTSGNYAGEASGNVINYAGNNALVNWGRSSVFTTAPGNAATATLIIRSVVTSNNPYCFVTNAFAGVAEANQTTPSNWSEGTSAGATYTSELSNDAGFTTLGAVASQGYVLPAGVANAINTNTTTISGSKITTGSITAAQINVTDLFSKNITYTGVITGGNVAGGGLIKSYNGKMVIDLVNGSIYIA